MPARKKQEIITFKADSALARAMRGVPNRSEFIRAAILHALENVCPLCKGTGILTPDQRRHWENFAENHALAECANCHAVHLICAATGNNAATELAQKTHQPRTVIPKTLRRKRS